MGSACWRVMRVPSRPVDELVDAFGRYVLQARGLAAATVRGYERVARRFLSERSEPLTGDFARLSGAAVNAFVLRESRRAPRSAGSVVCGLRALLRVLARAGVDRRAVGGGGRSTGGGSPARVGAWAGEAAAG